MSVCNVRENLSFHLVEFKHSYLLECDIQVVFFMKMHFIFRILLVFCYFWAQSADYCRKNETVLASGCNNEILQCQASLTMS